MIYLLTLAIAATRFLPHPPNFACLGALGLFAGCYLAGRRAYLVPAAALFLSDIVGHFAGVPGMGFYHPLVMAATYLAVTLAVPVGRLVRSANLLGRANWHRVPAGALIASTLFFLVSNFGVWLGPWYPMTLQGLSSCFINAVPFYGYTLAGDFCFVMVMFAAYEWSSLRRHAAIPAFARAS